MMKYNWDRRSLGIFFGLVALIAITRTYHFGSINLLPDASLAVFFFAGMYLRRWFIFPVYLLLAGLIDYSVISYGGVSDWCVTPGYLFLIPTYAAMWEAGRFSHRLEMLSVLDYLKVIGCVFVATSVAFVVSNYGFYVFSGRFEAFGLVQYFSSVVKYFPSYLLTTVLYSVVLLSLHGIVDVAHNRRKLST